jgi:hypothetical protein
MPWLSSRGLPFGLCILLVGLSVQDVAAQENSPDRADSLRGTVINSVTHEPVPRALVFSPDNRFATMTDAQGRFEFVLPAASPMSTSQSATVGVTGTVVPSNASSRPYMLMARKPGFLEQGGGDSQGVTVSQNVREITIALMPEALIVGRLTLSGSDAADRVTVELYRREIQDGRAHWVSRSITNSSSSGEFRFAELPAGSYKLFTHEEADSDPLGTDSGELVYAFPPIYFPNASDFESASPIELTPGKTFEADLSPVRQRYYRVSVPVINVQPNAPVSVSVYRQGRKGPGFALDYNGQDRRIEGSLPNGTFVLDAFSYGPTPMGGSTTITIQGAPVSGEMLLIPGRSIAVNVKEEFTSSAPNSGNPSPAARGRSALRGPRSYLDVSLVPSDDFVEIPNPSLRSSQNAVDAQLALEGVQPGRYWVRANTSRGYVASMSSGGVDLRHAPLVVGHGGVASAIDVTLRDDAAQLDGSVDLQGESDVPGSEDTNKPATMQSAFVYCIPVDDSAGAFTEWVTSEEGKFFPAPMAPGLYRLLAFRQKQTDLEYENADQMRAYDGKGQVVRLSPGQTEHVRLQLIEGGE